MRRIITAREQYECRLFLADAATSAASGGTAGCDPNTEDCSGESSVGGSREQKGSPPDATGPNTSNPGSAPTQGSNAAGFYDQRAPSMSVSDGVNRSAPSAGGGPSAAPVDFSPGEGVAQWHDEVLQGLQRNGLPATLAPQVEKQIGTESSGNPNAINNTDSNAAAGHPSQGLLQTIPSTFNQYHLPGDSMSITDPQANVDSAIGYAKSRYGPTLMNQQGQGMGSGHGY